MAQFIPKKLKHLSDVSDAQATSLLSFTSDLAGSQIFAPFGVYVGTAPPSAIDIWASGTRSLTDKANFTLHADYDSAKTAATQTSVDTVDGIVDTILADTNELQTNQGNWLTATSVTVSDKTGFSLADNQASVIIGTVNALGIQAKADVNAEVDTALADYDPPTNAEMEARTITSASYATASALSTVAGYVDSEISTIINHLTDIKGAGWSNENLTTIDSLIDTALSRLTSARAGYLDKLNVTGILAHSDAAGTYKADVSSLATSSEISALNDISLSDVWTYNDRTLTDKANFTLHSDYNAAKVAASQTSINTINGYLDTEVNSILTIAQKLDTMLELDGAVYRLTVNALEQAPSGGGGTADWNADERTAIRTILGIPEFGTIPDSPSGGALKVIDDFLDTEIAAIKSKTDLLPSDPADQSLIEAAITSATSNISTVTPQQIWEYSTRELTDKSDFVLTSDYDAAKTASSQNSIDNITSYIDSEIATIIDHLTDIKGTGWANENLTTIDSLIDTILVRLTSARAGYLDKLNVAGTLAHSNDASTYKANVANLATSTQVANLNNISTSQVLTQIQTALNETFTDETSLNPKSIKGRMRVIDWLLRNKMTVDETTGTATFYKDDNVTVAFTIENMFVSSFDVTTRKRAE